MKQIKSTHTHTYEYPDIIRTVNITWNHNVFGLAYEKLYRITQNERM